MRTAPRILRRMTCTPHNDEPDIDINLLPERQRLLIKLVEDIRQCRPPMVFGVHGDWGAGKTSFLQAVMYALTGKCPRQSELKAEDKLAKKKPTERQKQLAKWHENPPHAVWFEAWRYQNETAPVVALLHQLRESLSWSETPAAKLKQKASAGWSIMRKNLLLALDSITLKIEGEASLPLVAKGKVGAGFSPFHLSKARQESAAERHSTPLPSNQIRDALDSILANLLGNGSDKEMPAPDQRVVIFIDDLDRCAATAMFSLLESIKIYLNLRHCVFVLGINRHEVERGIISVLPEAPSEDQRQVRSHEYIEKLCGNIVRLPYPGVEAQRLMLRAWLHLETSQHGNAFLETVGELSVKFSVLPQNPRRIKMWCNTVLLMYEHRAKKLRPPLPNGTYEPPDSVEAAALVLMACLYTFYPVLHQAMAACENASFLLTLKGWCYADMDFDLAIFDGVKRVFAKPALIRQIVANPKAGPNAELLRRVYLQAAAQTDDRSPEPAPETALPLLTDPSSLSYFHPQRLVAEESITEAQIKPYLHLD